MTGCRGSCCAAFPLSTDVDELEARTRDLELEGMGTEGEYIADMVIPISQAEALQREIAFGGRTDALATDIADGDDRQYYKCRHWDEGTGLCRAYDERPKMCSRYPYGKQCEHGCSCRGEKSPGDQT